MHAFPRFSLHRSRCRGQLGILIATALVLGYATGSAVSAQPGRTTIVATKVTPPFAMRRDDGTWHGIAIDLWQQIATELGMAFEWRELDDLGSLIDSVSNGSVDAAVAALTITAPREKEMDFSHPYYRTGLSIAVKASDNNRFLLATTILALSFFAIGSAMWFYDWIRRRRSNRATREIRKGLLLVALVVIVSSLIAHIITFINLSHAPIKSPEDLNNVTVATVPASTSESYLKDQGIDYKPFPNLAAALRALSRGQIGAVLYDSALLRYLAKTDFKDRITVLPATFELQEYGIAFPSGSGLREEVNQNLIAIIQKPGWQKLVDRYLAEILKNGGLHGPPALISSLAAAKIEREKSIEPGN